MSLLLGWIIFLVALLFSIMLHEAGHFATAKKFRMKVTQFFVGFGQTLWSTMRGETEYGVKAIPLGGFVKITGMTALEDIDPADEERSFRRQPGWQRAIVLAAGSFMHFALAFFLLIVLAIGVGLENDNSNKIGIVGSCIPASAAAAASGSCQGSLGVAPARQAGVRPGRHDHRHRRHPGAQLDAARRGHPRAARGQADDHHRAAGRAAAGTARQPGQGPRPQGVVPGHR